VISHITPDRRDLRYSHQAQHTQLPVTIHYRDGRTEAATLVMDPDQVELYAIQLAQSIAARERALEAAGW
jgi:hypothetical protein